MRSYSVKENPIGLAVSEILRYKQTPRQTNKHPVTLLQGLSFKDYLFEGRSQGRPSLLFCGG